MRHDFRIEGLIMRVASKTNIDFKNVTQILAENIDKGTDKVHLYKKVYKYVYNNHLNELECENLIKILCERHDYKQWSLDDTNAVAKKLDYDFDKKWYTPEEFRTAMYLLRDEFESPLIESNISMDFLSYGRLADHYLVTNGTEQLVHDYFHIVCRT